MPDFVDNAAGYTSVTGTAHYLMSDTGTGKHLRLDQALTDGQIVAYYVIFDSATTSGFESGIGAWDDSANTLVVTSVTNSSNGGGKISWGEGQKTLYIVSNAATMVNTDDARLDAVDVDDMDAGDTPDGTENAAVSQGGDGVRLTTQQISGSPLTMTRGHAKNRKRGYSDFSKVRLAWAAVNGALVDLEPYETSLAGDAAGVNLALLGLAGLQLTTGTGATNHHALTLREGGVLAFNAARSLSQTMMVNIQQLTTPGQLFHTEYGYTQGAFTAAPARGIYFAADANVAPASATWVGVVKNASGTSTINTTIPIVASTPYVLTVIYNATLLRSEFWVNGVLGGSIANSTRVLADGEGLWQTVAIRKTTGTTARSIAIADHVWDNQIPAMAAGY